MNSLAQSDFLQSLGWALLHSLWQMGILWIVYVLLTANGKKLQARQRYNLALVLTSIGSMAFLCTLSVEYSSRNSGIFSGALIASATIENLLSSLSAWISKGLPALSIIYLLAIGLLFIRFFRQYFFTHQLIRTGLQKADPSLRLFVKETTQLLGIRKQVRIGLSDLINTPLTVGFWKPVILLPVAAVSHLSLRQTEAIILHELNHIRQNDYLVNLLIACLDILFFFNPFARLMTGILLREREHCCDDMVLQFKYPSGEYAGALLLLEKNRLSPIPLLAVSATGNGKKLLLNRVHRIIYGKPVDTHFNYKLLAFLVGALLLTFTGLVNPARVIADNLAAERQSAPSLTLVLPVSEQPLAFSTGQNNKKFISTAGNDALTTGSEAITVAMETEAALTEEAVLKELREAVYNSLEEEAAEKEAAYKNAAHNFLTVSTQDPVTVTGFASNTQPISFSIQESPAPSTAMQAEMESVPYIPATSFSYQYIQDTIHPQRYIPTVSDIKAREDVEKALKALEEIDWQKLEKEFSSQKLDVLKLQEELKKALQEVNWKKIEQELQSKYKIAAQEERMRQVYLYQAGQLQEAYKAQLNALQKQQQNKKQSIVMDRLLQNEQLKKCEEQKAKTESQKAATKVKKIVVI